MDTLTLAAVLFFSIGYICLIAYSAMTAAKLQQTRVCLERADSQIGQLYQQLAEKESEIFGLCEQVTDLQTTINELGEQIQDDRVYYTDKIARGQRRHREIVSGLQRELEITTINLACAQDTIVDLEADNAKLSLTAWAEKTQVQSVQSNNRLPKAQPTTSMSEAERKEQRLIGLMRGVSISGELARMLGLG